jgi:hypothetical protein
LYLSHDLVDKLIDVGWAAEGLKPLRSSMKFTNVDENLPVQPVVGQGMLQALQVAAQGFDRYGAHTMA